MIGEHDRQEPAAVVEMSVRLVQMLRNRLREIPEETPGPFAGSILYEEARYTAREPIATLVATNRARARDNLDRIFDLMIDDENAQLVAYPYSLYALIRASIESSATAMWLIQSDRRNDRVMRALQVSYRNTLDGVSLIRLFGEPEVQAADEARAERTLTRLNELKDQIPQLRQKQLTGPPKYTEILKAVSRTPGGPRDTFEFSSPITVWKISSSFIHGSDQLSRILSDVRQLEEFVDGVANFEFTPKVQLLAVGIAECVQLLIKVDERYAYLCTHDYGGRKVEPRY
jgi:hypothetical protein